MKSSLSRGILLAFATALLLACGSDGEFADLQAKMEEIKRRPQGRIEPPPEFKTYENFIYGASLLRSPFQPPVILEPVKNMVVGRKVFPDFDRPKEALEEFNIDALTMVGTLNRPGGSLYALLRDNKSGIHRVAVANYIGRNHGKVTEITPTKLDVIELIPDGEDGWVERPRSIVIKDE